MADTATPFLMGQDTLQQLDPDLYNRIKPHINEIVKELNKQELSEKVFNAVIDELINSLEQSGNIPMEDDMAVPAISNIDLRQPYRQSPYWNTDRRRCPGCRGGLSTDNLIRLLLLRELGYFWI